MAHQFRVVADLFQMIDDGQWAREHVGAFSCFLPRSKPRDIGRMDNTSVHLQLNGGQFAKNHNFMPWW
jgi:hypothetical protein